MKPWAETDSTNRCMWCGQKKKGTVLCVLLSETTGEQVSEYWSSGCHDYLHEPGVYVVKLKKEVQKSSAAGHVHYLLLDFSASSETLTVSQQEFLVQFGFHGDSRERYALFKQEKNASLKSFRFLFSQCLYS